jgi:signal transduction histidine kinase
VTVSSQILPPSAGEHSDQTRCQIVVEDNGIGFDLKYVDRIFTPFQRLHGRHEFEGTGMGLAICRKIVERHNGSITAVSVVGKGSSFVVTLPVTQPEVGTTTWTPSGNLSTFSSPMTTPTTAS